MAVAVLRRLKRKSPEWDGIRFAREIRKEKNAGSAAFLVCALLDNCLKIAIYAVLPNKVAAERLFEDRSPLDSFSAKIPNRVRALVDTSGRSGSAIEHEHASPHGKLPRYVLPTRSAVREPAVDFK